MNVNRELVVAALTIAALTVACSSTEPDSLTTTAVPAPSATGSSDIPQTTTSSPSSTAPAPPEQGPPPVSARIRTSANPAYAGVDVVGGAKVGEELPFIDLYDANGDVVESLDVISLAGGDPEVGVWELDGGASSFIEAGLSTPIRLKFCLVCEGTDDDWYVVVFDWQTFSANAQPMLASTEVPVGAIVRWVPLLRSEGDLVVSGWDWWDYDIRENRTKRCLLRTLDLADGAVLSDLEVRCSTIRFEEIEISAEGIGSVLGCVGDQATESCPGDSIWDVVDLTSGELLSTIAWSPGFLPWPSDPRTSDFYLARQNDRFEIHSWQGTSDLTQPQPGEDLARTSKVAELSWPGGGPCAVESVGYSGNLLTVVCSDGNGADLSFEELTFDMSSLKFVD